MSFNHRLALTGQLYISFYLLLFIINDFSDFLCCFSSIFSNQSSILYVHWPPGDRWVSASCWLVLVRCELVFINCSGAVGLSELHLREWLRTGQKLSGGSVHSIGHGHSYCLRVHVYLLEVNCLWYLFLLEISSYPNPTSFWK